MRLTRVHKVIWGGIGFVAALLVIFVLVRWVIPVKSLPMAPSDMVTAPTTAPATSAATPTWVPTLDTTPIPTPTEPPIPKNGDERGCPMPYNTVDKNDPYCKKKKQKEIYKQHYASNPAFKCTDGRNEGLGAGDLKKFVPCVNSSFRLEISSSNNRMTLYQSTSNKVLVQQNKPAVTSARAKGKDWLVWQQFSSGGYSIQMNHDPDLAYFGIYARTGATGEWARMGNNPWFENGNAYQVVVFWNDPAKPADDPAKPADAPLPPSFSWNKVAKH